MYLHCSAARRQLILYLVYHRLGAASEGPGEAEDPSKETAPCVAATAGGAEFEFEEIMSDEEELPEYQEFEEEGAEEEYIVEEWEDWLKPYSLLQEFQCVPPLVHLTNPAITGHQIRLLSPLAVDHEVRRPPHTPLPTPSPLF